MSSYWKSPYRELNYTNSVQDDSSYVSESNSRKVIGPGRITKPGQAVFPLDWLDWTTPLPSSKINSPHSPRFRRPGGTIKSILKVPSEADKTDTGRISQYTDSYASTRPISSSTNAQRDKKRVTFGGCEVNHTDEEESAVTGHNFQYDRSTDAHHNRLRLAYPLDELAKQNMKKLLGNLNSPALPLLSGKSIVAKSSAQKTVYGSGRCMHMAEFKCSQCFQKSSDMRLPKDEQERKFEINKSGFVLSAASADCSSGEKEESIQSRCMHGAEFKCSQCVQDNNRRNSKTDSGLGMKTEEQNINKLDENSSNIIKPESTESFQQAYGEGTKDRLPVDDGTKHSIVFNKPDPVKRYSSPWTKAFVGLPQRKSTFRFRAGRFTSSAGSALRDLGLAQKFEPQQSPESITKLHITGEGKIIGVCVNESGVETNRLPSDTILHRNFINSTLRQGSAASSGRFGYKIPATDISPEDNGRLPHSPNSAPSILKAGLEPKTLAEAADDYEIVGYLDKTSQIMTWLNDVREKQNFVPKNARLYRSKRNTQQLR